MPQDTQRTTTATDTPHASSAGTWTFGGDGPTVNRIGFGAMRLASREAFSGRDSRGREQSLAVLRRAVERGVDHIDTAAFYFSPLRSANELINSALAPYPENLVIATKVGPRRDASGGWRDWARPEELRGEVEENLRQLGRDHLDLVNLRMNGPRPVDELFGALAELRQAGLIRHLGVSNVTTEQLAQARAIAPVVAVQNRFSLDSRRGDSAEVLRRCGELGIAFVPFFAIAGQHKESGRPGEDRDDTVRAVAEVARAHDATPAQVRLAWTLHQGPHVLGIPGTGDPAHLDENLAAGALRLSAAELERLETAGGTADGSEG
ncbi:aldo/keto reductase [Streptomyces sp. NPDC049954]|uniref:aldo/keto reductase n=1 Tax=Streptomyces sp. NPDC049954 TaxID=3155779 RepID=UPI003426451D